jgi:hypothetical protein
MAGRANAVLEIKNNARMVIAVEIVAIRRMRFIPPLANE